MGHADSPPSDCPLERWRESGGKEGLVACDRLREGGVDRNPMAVELARVVLWIETVKPGKPLGFLDANPRCGDSCSTSSRSMPSPQASPKPPTNRSPETTRSSRGTSRSSIATRSKGRACLLLSPTTAAPDIQRLATTIHAVRRLPEDTAAEIADKELRFAAARRDPRMENAAQAADLYLAAFLMPKTPANAGPGNALIPTTDDLRKGMCGTVFGPRHGAAAARSTPTASSPSTSAV